MRYAMLLAFAVAATACEADNVDEMGETEPATEMTPAPETPATGGGAAIGVDTLAGVGAYLTDGQGRSLYLLENEDEPDACVDACATAWPPFTTEAGGTPRVEGAQQDVVATVARPDGSQQITYDGHPLYYYAEDTAAGQVNGQDVTDEWGEWYLVSPTGDPQEGGAEAQRNGAEAGTADGGSY